MLRASHVHKTVCLMDNQSEQYEHLFQLPSCHCFVTGLFGHLWVIRATFVGEYFVPVLWPLYPKGARFPILVFWGRCLLLEFAYYGLTCPSIVDYLIFHLDLIYSFKNMFPVYWTFFQLTWFLSLDTLLSFNTYHRRSDDILNCSANYQWSLLLPVRKENEVALQSAEIRIVRWMCDVKKVKVSSTELRERLELDDIILVIQHVLWKEDKWLGEEMYGVWSGGFQTKR